ncbi:hypothetical protein ACX80N_14310 [Arthrobacter sp. MDT2-16]
MQTYVRVMGGRVARCPLDRDGAWHVAPHHEASQDLIIQAAGNGSSTHVTNRA